MINFRTPSDQLMKELFEEEGKAIFWLKKKHHGEKGYERMRDELIARCERMQKTQISDVIEYISPNGNRWMAFECCQYYKKAGLANTAPMAFCYYETYGSVGAYVIGRGEYSLKDATKTVIHFTNHFFLRFCQRLKVPMRSRWMVQKFIEVIPGFLFGSNGRDEHGHLKFDVRLPGSIGRGIMFDDAPVIEIRSYLTDPELNRKQLRETERLRGAYKLQTFEPLDVRMVRLMRSDDFSGNMVKELESISVLSGIDKGILASMANIRIFLVEAIIDLGYVRFDDTATWKRLGERTADIDFMDFVKDYPAEGGGMEKARQLYETLKEFGERSGIKGYDTKAVMDKVIENWQKAVDDLRHEVLTSRDGNKRNDYDRKKATTG